MIDAQLDTRNRLHISLYQLSFSRCQDKLPYVLKVIAVFCAVGMCVVRLATPNFAAKPRRKDTTPLFLGTLSHVIAATLSYMLELHCTMYSHLVFLIVNKIILD